MSIMCQFVKNVTIPVTYMACYGTVHPMTRWLPVLDLVPGLTQIIQ